MLNRIFLSSLSHMNQKKIVILFRFSSLVCCSESFGGKVNSVKSKRDNGTRLKAE